MKYCYPTTFSIQKFESSGNPKFGEIKTINQMAYYLAAKLNLSINQMKSDSRNHNLSEARFLLMHFAHYYLRMTKRSIGKFLNRDHSTVVYGMKKCNDLLDTDKDFQRKFMLVKNKIS